MAGAAAGAAPARHRRGELARTPGPGRRRRRCSTNGGSPTPTGSAGRRPPRSSPCADGSPPPAGRRTPPSTSPPSAAGRRWWPRSARTSPATSCTTAWTAPASGTARVNQPGPAHPGQAADAGRQPDPAARGLRRPGRRARRRRGGPAAHRPGLRHRGAARRRRRRGADPGGLRLRPGRAARAGPRLAGRATASGTPRSRWTRTTWPTGGASRPTVVTPSFAEATRLLARARPVDADRPGRRRRPAPGPPAATRPTGRPS